MTADIEPRARVDGSEEGLGAGLSFFAATAVGLLLAALVVPVLVPSLVGSLLGSSPKAYWYLSRGSAFVALGLLWISMLLGLLITDKMAKSWPGAPAAFATHEYVSLLGLGFAAFHALILLGDHYIKYPLAQILVPFAGVNYRPFWVGLGQLGLYVWLIINASFYVRKSIGPTAWKLIHYASFFNFVVALVHALAAGTESKLSVTQTAYWIMGGSVLFLTIYRVVASVAGPERRPPKVPAPPRQESVPPASP